MMVEGFSFESYEDLPILGDWLEERDAEKWAQQIDNIRWIWARGKRPMQGRFTLELKAARRTLVFYWVIDAANQDMEGDFTHRIKKPRQADHLLAPVTEAAWGVGDWSWEQFKREDHGYFFSQWFRSEVAALWALILDR